MIRRRRQWRSFLDHRLSRVLAFGPELGNGAPLSWGIPTRLREDPDNPEFVEALRRAWQDIGADLLGWWQEQGEQGEPWGLKQFGQPGN